MFLSQSQIDETVLVGPLHHLHDPVRWKKCFYIFLLSTFYSQIDETVLVGSLYLQDPVRWKKCFYIFLLSAFYSQNLEHPTLEPGFKLLTSHHNTHFLRLVGT